MLDFFLFLFPYVLAHLINTFSFPNLKFLILLVDEDLDSLMRSNVRHQESTHVQNGNTLSSSL